MKKVLIILLAIMLLGTVFAEDSNDPLTTVNPVLVDAQPLPTLHSDLNDGNAPAQLPPIVGKPKPAKLPIKRMKYNIEKAKENYTKARARVIDAKGEYATAKKQLQAKHTAYKKLVQRYKDANGGIREKYQHEIKEKTVEILSNQADALIKKLLHLQEEGYAPEDTNEWIAQLEEIKILMESDDVNRTEIISSIKEIRDDLIPLIKYRVQQRAARALDNKFQAIFKKSANAVERVTTLAEKLSEKGYDTTNLELAIGTFEGKIAEAEIKYEEAKALWKDANTAVDKHKVLRQGFEIAKETNRIILDGFHELKKALQEIRDQQPNLPDVSTDTNNEGDSNA